MSAEKSSEKNRQQVGWWVPAFILFILFLIGIRYLSSQGWWENTFNLGRQANKPINTGLSVQVPSQLSEVSASVQNPLNPDRPTQLPTLTESEQSNRDSNRERRALW